MVQTMGRESFSSVQDRTWVLENDSNDCIWTCCGENGRAPGCKSGEHSATSPLQDESVTLAPQRSGISSLVSPLSSIPSLVPHSLKENGDDFSALQGTRLMQALSDAEKESEKLAHDKSKSPSLWGRSGGSGPLPSDIDFESLPDFSPPLETLEGKPQAFTEAETPFSQPLELSTDPDRHLLHEAELTLAAKLRLTCASYLCTKRRIFKGLVESLQEGKEYKKSYAQTACKVDARKARILFSAFEAVGWFDRAYYSKYLTGAKSGSAAELSDSSDTLSSVDSALLAAAPPGMRSEVRNAENNGHASTAPDISEPTAYGERPGSSSSTTLNSVNGTSSHSRSARKQKEPVQILQTSSAFKPINDPLPPMTMSTPTPLAPAPRPALDMIVEDASAPHTPPRDLIAAGSPETYQWRKTGSGKKTQVPICPYPRTWADADNVDRELVRLKRRDGKQWEELFEWWRGQGRNSLKNASCLAVRYSILKKNFESDWLRHGI